MAPMPNPQSGSCTPQPGKKATKKRSKDEKEPGKKPKLKSSTRIAPNIDEAGPQAAKKQALKRPNLENRGPMLEMQMRVRAKEAKRKNEEDETAQMPSKNRCEREERIAEVQLKAFWNCFPLPSSGTKLNTSPSKTNQKKSS